MDRQPAAAGRLDAVRRRRRRSRRCRTPSCRSSRCGCRRRATSRRRAFRSLAGRDFTEADGFGRPRRDHRQRAHRAAFWPGQDPLGKHVTLKMMSPEPREVVGVVGEVKIGSLDAGARGLGDGDLRAGGAVRLQRRALMVRTAVAARVAGAAAGRRGARHRSRAAGARDRSRCSASSRSRSASGRSAMLLLGGVRGAGAGAGVGRHLQRAGLHRAPARARDRHPHGARRAVGGRAPPGGGRRAEADAGRRGARPGAGRRARPGHGGAAVRREPVRSGHVHRRGRRWSWSSGWSLRSCRRSAPPASTRL